MVPILLAAVYDGCFTLFPFLHSFCPLYIFRSLSLSVCVMLLSSRFPPLSLILPFPLSLYWSDSLSLCGSHCLHVRPCPCLSVCLSTGPCVHVLTLVPVFPCSSGEGQYFSCVMRLTNFLTWFRKAFHRGSIEKNKLPQWSPLPAPFTYHGRIHRCGWLGFNWATFQVKKYEYSI